jgi:hypothetical protein
VDVAADIIDDGRFGSFALRVNDLIVTVVESRKGAVAAGVGSSC